jgi:hypothetical protein
MLLVLSIILIITLLLVFSFTTINKKGGVIDFKTRVGREIDNKFNGGLIAENYVVEWDAEKNLYSMIVKKDNITYNIDIPRTYPYEQVSVNGWKLLDDSPGFIISNSINEFKKPNKILIYCHPDPVTILHPDENKFSTLESTNSYHWFNDVIYEQAIKAGVDNPTDALVLCVDTQKQIKYVKENLGSANMIQVEYQKERVKKADGFSEEFINNNKDMFDTIAIPDCGGSWWEDGNIDNWREKIINITSMLKSGGTLTASKFPGKDSTRWYQHEDNMSDKTEEELATQVADSLRTTEMFEDVAVESFELGEHPIWYISVKKK